MRRDCACPNANHKHGTVRAYNADKCRCDECKTARREHQRACRRRVAELAWSEGRTALLLDATGTRRRLHALAAIGYGVRSIADHLCVSKRAVSYYLTGTRVQEATAAKIAAMYDELWDKPLTGGGAKLARAAAAARGYAPPMAWDDETIDDPSAKPYRPRWRVPASDVDEVAVAEVMTGRRVTLTKAERAEVVRLMTERGHSAAWIADRLGTSDRSVTRRRSAA